jgi:hypothetical protein
MSSFVSDFAEKKLNSGEIRRTEGGIERRTVL